MRVLQVLAGSAQALYELGVCYYNGSVVAEDERKSFLLFERAAELGHVGAMFMYHSALSLQSTISHPTPVFVCLFLRTVHKHQDLPYDSMEDCRAATSPCMHA